MVIGSRARQESPGLDVQLGSCSLDCRLGNVFQVLELARFPYIDLTKEAASEQFMRQIEVPDGEPFIIQPGELVLATTREYLEIDDDLAARLEGRSNLSRMAVALYPGMRICAFTFELLTTPSDNPYWGRRSAASGPNGKSAGCSMRGGGRSELSARPQGQPDHHRRSRVADRHRDALDAQGSGSHRPITRVSRRRS